MQMAIKLEIGNRNCRLGIVIEKIIYNKKRKNTTIMTKEIMMT